MMPTQDGLFSLVLFSKQHNKAMAADKFQWIGEFVFLEPGPRFQGDHLTLDSRKHPQHQQKLCHQRQTNRQTGRQADRQAGSGRQGRRGRQAGEDRTGRRTGRTNKQSKHTHTQKTNKSHTHTMGKKKDLRRGARPGQGFVSCAASPTRKAQGWGRQTRCAWDWATQRFERSLMVLDGFQNSDW